MKNRLKSREKVIVQHGQIWTVVPIDRRADVGMTKQLREHFGGWKGTEVFHLELLQARTRRASLRRSRQLHGGSDRLAPCRDDRNN